MKKTVSMAITLLLAGNVTSGYALEGISEDNGKVLFGNAKLGTSGKSCASCHPGGKKLEWAATYDDAKLEEISNRCIQKAMKGKPLKEESDDLKSLVMYLKTFAGPGR